MSNKKAGNIISIVLSSIFGVVAAVFVVLTILTVMGGGKITLTPDETKTINYVLDSEVTVNALSNNLASVISNNEKRMEAWPEGILEWLKPAFSINPNLTGWLSIPGTEIDTAITKSNDNDHYLTRSFYETVTNSESINYGTPFLDYQCRGDGTLSKNMIIYAHTTGKSDYIPKQSFRSLYEYQREYPANNSYDPVNYYINNHIIKYSTLTTEYTYKICAVFYSTTEERADNGYFFNYIYPDMSDENMEGYIRQVNERNLINTGVTLEPTDKIITLSTCIYVYGGYDTRLVVVARLLREGESEDIDPTLVSMNENYRRPQVWYSANGLTNPYANSPKWEPSP